MKKLPELLEITWSDSVSQTGWFTPEEAHEWGAERVVIKTVGWLVREDDHQVTLTMCYSDFGRVGGLWAIPKGCIIKRRKLR